VRKVDFELIGAPSTTCSIMTDLWVATPFVVSNQTQHTALPALQATDTGA
jgi:hypothetical protein